MGALNKAGEDEAKKGTKVEGRGSIFLRPDGATILAIYIKDEGMAGRRVRAHSVSVAAKSLEFLSPYDRTRTCR